MKVCSPQLGLSPESFLGGEVHDVQLIDQLCQKGLQIYTLLPRNRPFLKSPNLHVECLPFTKVVPPHLFNLFTLPYLFKIYSRERFDILRIHSPYFLGFAARIFKYFHPEVKVVTTIHLKEERWDLIWILKHTINIYDHIFTVSDYLKNWVVKEFGVDPKKITVIYNGVNKDLRPTQKDKKLLRKYGLENKVVLLNLGQLIPRKNVLFLLNVFEKVSKNYPEVILIYCGAGVLKDELKKRIKLKSLSKKVMLLDPVFGEEKNKLFNLADIFLFPSLNEGFGLVAAEAMASGKPVITSDNTSLPEIVINTKTGYLAKTNNITDWVNNIELLASNKKLRADMGKKGLKRINQLFTWDKVATKSIQTYKDLV